MLRASGITVVFNLWNKVDPDLSGAVLYVNWPIRGNAMPENADVMVQYGADLLRSGERLLVHCEAGVNRSAWFCAAIIARVNEWPLDQAMKLVQTQVPRAKAHQAFFEEMPAARLGKLIRI